MSKRAKAGGLMLLIMGLAAWASTAWAGTSRGGDGGNTVTVGVSTAVPWPAAPKVTPSGGTGPGPSCTYTLIMLSQGAGFQLNPGGATPGQWYLVQCPGGSGHAVWVPTVQNASPPPVIVGVKPSAVAAQAAASIVLPSPSIQVNPADFSVVNLATWLAVNPALWHPFRASATVAGVTATAVATPQTVAWSMGDGGVVVCDGPGTAYQPGLPASLQSTSCAYTYRRSSYGEPSIDGNPNDGAFPVTASVTWSVTWTAVGAPGGGVLPSLHTESSQAVRVEQVESVGVVQ